MHAAAAAAASAAHAVAAHAAAVAAHTLVRSSRYWGLFVEKPLLACKMGVCRCLIIYSSMHHATDTSPVVVSVAPAVQVFVALLD